MTTPAGGYFAAPRLSLDPALFNGDSLRPEVRKFILSTARNALKDYGFDNVARWLHIWLAGSGVSYQWGNGDLDVLMGVDYSRFTRSNPDYSGIDEDSAANSVNKYLKKNVWSMTKQTDFNGSIYEVTFFWNPGIGNNISVIHPYAAYDVQKNSWVVRPPQLPHNPAELFSPDWYQAADADRTLTTELVRRYRSASRKLKNPRPGAAANQVNANTELYLVNSQASALFDDIHVGRRAAFAEQGHGYRDYHNFRWQRAKATGVIKDLKPIVEAARLSAASRDTELYGEPITGAQEALRRAELWKSGRLR